MTCFWALVSFEYCGSLSRKAWNFLMNVSYVSPCEATSLICGLKYAPLKFSKCTRTSKFLSVVCWNGWCGFARSCPWPANDGELDACPPMFICVMTPCRTQISTTNDVDKVQVQRLEPTWDDASGQKQTSLAPPCTHAPGFCSTFQACRGGGQSEFIPPGTFSDR